MRPAAKAELSKLLTDRRKDLKAGGSGWGQVPDLMQKTARGMAVALFMGSNPPQPNEREKN
jgi:hypothetical protein